MKMKSNVSFIAGTGPHKPLVGGSNPSAATLFKVDLRSSP